MITLTALVSLGLATLSPIQGVSKFLFSGQAIENEGIRLYPYGGGKIAPTNELAIIGQYSLKVETTNAFQGGILEWRQPIPLADLSKDKQNLLQISVYVSPTATTSTAPAGGRTETGAPTQPLRAIENIRLLIRTSDGKLSEALYSLVSASGTTNRWIRVGIPLQAIPGFLKTNQEVSAIAVSGDAPGTFYLGELRVVSDDTPIQGFLSHRSLVLGRGDAVTLWASAEAGFSTLIYEWDFDHRDGIQVDATGPVVYHRFRIPSYNPDPRVGELPKPLLVTVTIRDAFGLKPPWQGTIEVVVNP
ncbi:MAG: hypothetical protein K6T17_04120 [Fimbriimonadales bacterium]|nr:hypothetical protein [Fimbriimonadales bacterium]